MDGVYVTGDVGALFSHAETVYICDPCLIYGVFCFRLKKIKESFDNYDHYNYLYRAFL